MSTKNVWDEEWAVGQRQIIAVLNGRARSLSDWRYAYGTDARLKLAAAAPDLVRALLELEWTASDATSEMSERRYGLCPWCYQSREQGHTKNCDLDLALRKAGVR